MMAGIWSIVLSMPIFSIVGRCMMISPAKSSRPMWSWSKMERRIQAPSWSKTSLDMFGLQKIMGPCRFINQNGTLCVGWKASLAKLWTVQKMLILFYDSHFITSSCTHFRKLLYCMKTVVRPYIWRERIWECARNPKSLTQLMYYFLLHCLAFQVLETFI